MANIKLKLLGDLNKLIRADQKASLVPKYIASIRASDLSLYFKYRKIGRKTPFKVDVDSFISIDPDIQRGLTDIGNLRQEEKKILEIKESLLGVSKENPNVFLGTLVWNIRPPGLLSVLVLHREGRPPEYELEIDAGKVWLTDSAHRHLGVCEAVRAATVAPNKYPRFSPDFEFPVEIYNLDSTREKLLFRELNSKQKKITAAKAQQVDATSKVGLLKSRIIELDQGSQRLFYQNIEVNSNSNDRHTLMTMSVFTSTIKEMFGSAVIAESADDEDVREVLADYYCKFLYKLRDAIVVKCLIRNQEMDIHPFRNLYLEKILPVDDEVSDGDTDEDVAETRLRMAREEANLENKVVRDQEKIHSNAVLKAIARVGGYVRFMSNWESVIDNLQMKLIALNSGRYFQASNDELLSQSENGVPIATKKEDGFLNIQVVSQVISQIERLLKKKLDINFQPRLFLIRKNAIDQELTKQTGYTQLVSRLNQTYLDLRFEFEVGNLFAVEKTVIRMKVVPQFPVGRSDVWKEVEKKGGGRLLPAELRKVEGYEHPIYGVGVARYAAIFNLDLPAYSAEYEGQFSIDLGLEYYDFDGVLVSKDFSLPCQLN